MFIIKKITTILFGSLLLSIGVNFFLIPFQLLDGGMIGMGLIIKYLTGFQTGLAIILLSVPIFTLAWIYNRSYFYNSLHGMLFSSLAIDYLSPLHYPFIAKFQLPAIISSIVGGVFIGLGIGMMLRYKTSTGGTDLLAQLLSKVIKVNLGIIIFVIDAIVIVIGGILISTETLILSIITIIFVGLFTTICTWNLQY
ncbi:uncharacterized membrane-anchored protein YitT (DUF2179 family) [Salirhabdus euzebyi]|uniref:Uncharacterized membrane-anchored protein YitT (DUF2179 family) n=1 Tax=Salirhabdus euzebyi TaxID=394506 RepID=A0A841Q2X7_9BACI|nr:YitT family protein [Salirhabdus euzebyi]MBB6451848.1 uncharacterized membrane-anchored protein YitT (DUF2179 family) [Salirhabdus euzebyi]